MSKCNVIHTKKGKGINTQIQHTILMLSTKDNHCYQEILEYSDILHDRIEDNTYKNITGNYHYTPKKIIMCRILHSQLPPLLCPSFNRDL